MPFPGLDHPCVEKAPDQVQNTPIADLGRDQAHQLVLVDFVKESTDVSIQDPEVAFVDLLPLRPASGYRPASPEWVGSPGRAACCAARPGVPPPGRRRRRW